MIWLSTEYFFYENITDVTVDSISALLPILSIWGGGPWVGLRSKTPVSSKGRVKKETLNL